jgi:hypothetical protein
MTKLVSVKTHDLSDSQKIDMVMRSLFGDVDEETLTRKPGLLEEFSDFRKLMHTIAYGGGLTSLILVLRFLGVPTDSAWGVLVKIVSSNLLH